MSCTEAVLNSLTGVDRGRNVTWVEDALCATPGLDPEIWFPLPPNSPQESKRPRKHRETGAREIYAQKVAYAISICDTCPVKAQCLADAENRNERHGIWGGKDFYRTRTDKQVAKAS